MAQEARIDEMMTRLQQDITNTNVEPFPAIARGPLPGPEAYAPPDQRPEPIIPDAQACEDMMTAVNLAMEAQSGAVNDWCAERMRLATQNCRLDVAADNIKRICAIQESRLNAAVTEETVETETKTGEESVTTQETTSAQ